MVSGGGLAEGREIRLGALVFIADDSAWLQEAPSTSRSSPSAGRRTFARVSTAFFCGSRRLSTGRLPQHLRSPLLVVASDLVDRGFSGG